MADEWTFTPPGRGGLELNDMLSYAVVGSDGSGQPRVNLDNQAIAGRSGRDFRYAAFDRRRFTLILDILGTSLPDLRAKERALIGAVRFLSGRTSPEIGVLELREPTGDRWALDCAVLGGLDLKDSELLSPFVRRTRVEFAAPHPFWYDPAPSEVVASPQRQSGFSVPMKVPTAFARGNPLGLLDVDYQGDAISYSTVWEVDGPAVNPLLIHVASGRRVAFDGLTVPIGSTLRVVMGHQPQAQGHQFSALLDDVTQIQHLTSNSVPLFLDPDTSNVFQYSEEGDLQAGDARITWHDEYVAAG